MLAGSACIMLLFEVGLESTVKQMMEVGLVRRSSWPRWA